MASIDVHGDIGKIEGLECVVDAVHVCGLGTGALGDVQVGDQVGNRVGF